jgi:hypothetical protein
MFKRSQLDKCRRERLAQLRQQLTDNIWTFQVSHQKVIKLLNRVEGSSGPGVDDPGQIDPPPLEPLLINDQELLLRNSTLDLPNHDLDQSFCYLMHLFRLLLQLVESLA